MNEIRIFENESFGEVRVAGTSEDPLFCMADICRILGLRVDAVQSRLSDAPIRIGVIDSLGREQKMNFVNEKNLYKVIMRSDKPQAEPFQDWVCGEVLPSIRKTGRYSTSQELDVKEKIEAIGAIRNVLNLNEASTILLLKQVCDPLSLPLPNYVSSKDNLLSAKELLKRNGIELSSQAFNLTMIGKGFMEVKSRQSSKGGTKNFKSLTKEGLEFGENQVSPNNPKETQPLYYVNKFENLLKMLGLWKSTK